DFILHEQQYLLYFVHTALADQKGEIRSTMDVLCISPKVSGMGTTLLTWERLYFRSTPSCGSKIIAFPKRAPLTLDYLRLILIYNVPKTTAWAHERVIR